MYKGQVFDPIPDQNIKIWKYMKFNWFEEMLMERKLYFTRVDRFEDKSEGRVRGVDTLRHALFEKYRKNTYANCWHEKDYESNLMWEKYSKDKGIVIQSTFKRLVESLEVDSINEEYLDRVKYIDSNIISEIKNNLRIPFFLKEPEYYDEHEIRAMIQIMNPGSWDLDDTGGIDVPVLLDELIEKIIVFPYAPYDFYNSVQAIVNKSGLKIHVEESCLTRNRISISEAKDINIDMIVNIGQDASGNYKFIQTTDTATAYLIDQKYQRSLNQNKER